MAIRAERTFRPPVLAGLRKSRQADASTTATHPPQVIKRRFH
jgi:hypothetical protein